MTFAQDGASAKYDGMSRSAVAAGYVDYVLSPKGIARELARIARHPYMARETVPPVVEPTPAPGKGLSTVFHVLRRYAGVDFTHYRQTTIMRRIQRRMVVHKIERIEEYINFAQSNPAEIKALYQDVLISVTSFFRKALPSFPRSMQGIAIRGERRFHQNPAHPFKRSRDKAGKCIKIKPISTAHIDQLDRASAF